MKRKILSLVLVVAMLTSMAVLVPTASATETVATVSLSGSTVAKVGETVEIDVIMTSDLPVLSYTLGFTYDATKLTLTNIVDNLGDGIMSKSLKNGPSYKEVLGNAPYDAFGWSQTDNTSRDISAGVAIATLVFTVEQAGEAYVEILNLADSEGWHFNEFLGGTPADKVKYNGDPIALVDAKATVAVIPADYATAFVATDADWDFEDGVIIGMLNESAIDYTGTIVIPSEIGGVAVTGIAGAAFDGYEASTIVIPASVEFIEAGAIYNCANLTSVYVLGSAVEFENAAIGYEGSWRSGKLRNAAIILNADETCALTTFYAAAGSTAEAYAAAGDGTDFFPFVVSAGPNTVTYSGNTYLVGDTATVPGSAKIDGKTVVAWTDGANTYLPGETMSVSGAVTLEPITITAPVTNTVVDFKFAEQESDLAMRFTANLSIEDYATLADLGTVTLGMLITPSQRVAKAGAFTKEALDALDVTHKYVDIAIDGYYNLTATDYVFAGSLKGFSASTIASNPNFAAIVYATVTTDEGDTFTVYGDFNYAALQNVKGVAESFVDSDDLYDTQKGWLANLLTKFGA